MAVVIPFTPSLAPSSPPFQFDATLDGDNYTCIVTWNIASQRWYLRIKSLTNVDIVMLPLLASPNPTRLTSIFWRADNGGEAVVIAPGHGLAIGVPVDLAISGVVIDAYNGYHRCYPISGESFTYPLSFPGGHSNFGSYGKEISMTAGYFDTRLVWFSIPNTIVIT